MSKRIDNIVNKLTSYIEEQIQPEVETALGVKHTKDGLKSFDMYEGVWWLDQFMHDQFDNKDNIRRKDRDI